MTKIVLYRYYTSNHNGARRLAISWSVVLYRYSTSNHNLITDGTACKSLSYIVILHQTTTSSSCFHASGQLSYIVILHQTTTLRVSVTQSGVLSYIVILHQTTTTLDILLDITRCLISLFYIKPQPSTFARMTLSCCLISLFYIKPQL